MVFLSFYGRSPSVHQTEMSCPSYCLKLEAIEPTKVGERTAKLIHKRPAFSSLTRSDSPRFPLCDLKQSPRLTVWNLICIMHLNLSPQLRPTKIDNKSSRTLKAVWHKSGWGIQQEPEKPSNHIIHLSTVMHFGHIQ